MERDSISEPDESPSPVPPPQETPTAAGFQKPGDYYSSPPESSPGKTMPKWAALGCGGAGCLALLVMLAVAGFVSNQGATRVLAWMFNQMEAETMQMIGPDVTPEQKSQLQHELRELTAKLEREEIGLLAIQPILQDLRTAVGDQTLTSDEVDALIAALRAANSSSKPAASPNP